ncbi:hypothetical protein LLG95_02095 [bacterium]|nr:hypothetical protein [bacterium]
MKTAGLVVMLCCVVLMQGCAGVSDKISESMGARKLHVKAMIDGSDFVKVQGNSLWLEHRAWRLPGQPGENRQMPIYVNGRDWNPVWTKMNQPQSSLNSSTYELKEPLALSAGDVRIEVVMGRGSVTVAEKPDASNRETLSVLFDDDSQGGADWYDVIIHNGKQQIQVRAFIDGSDCLKIQGNKVWWQHRRYNLPGKWQGADEPTYINGEQWMPSWDESLVNNHGALAGGMRENENRQFSDKLTIKNPLPREANDNIRLKINKGRGKVTIDQYPNQSNGYTLSVLFDDDSIGGADLYDVLIEY